jgi:hypothetical protein
MVRRSRSKNVNFETIPDGEAEQIQEITDLTVKILDMHYSSKGQPALRQVHPKSHGCVKATFEVRDDLDKSLAVGLFAQPGRSYDALIRFSNAAGLVGPDISPDGKHGSRGMAIKVLGGINRLRKSVYLASAEHRRAGQA